MVILPHKAKLVRDFVDREVFDSKLSVLSPLFHDRSRSDIAISSLCHQSRAIWCE